MARSTEPFEINLNGTIFTVEPGFSGLNVYRLYSDTGSYLIAKDHYNIWVELNSARGSSNISLNLVGKKIDDHNAAISSLDNTTVLFY